MNATDRIIMIDTETTNSIDDPLCYDVGYQIFSLAEGVLVERSFVNADVFYRADLMKDAYFAEKIPQYLEELNEGTRKAKFWKTIKQIIRADCEKYDVKIACAHNAMFDNRALNTTQRYITSSQYRYFLPYGVEWWDTLKMARQTLKENDDYRNFCETNSYLTANGQLRFTAEVIYRWLINNTDFEECHTGLEDVKIEREIFEYLLTHNAEIDGRLWA